MSQSRIRPYVPRPFRRAIFNQIHNLAHPGVKASVRLVADKFVWPGMNKDVSLWAKTCVACQKNKVQRHTKSPLGEFAAPEDRFTVVHIDIVGPMAPSDGYVYCLTCVDRFTNWIEAIPVRDITAETIARAFYDNWIVRFGVPSFIVTDRGTQFESSTFQSLAKLIGARVKHTTAYHPQCNGKIERQHRTIKAAIKAHGSPAWTRTLPTVLLGLRVAIPSDGAYPSSVMVYGKSLRVPGEFFADPSTSTLSEGFVQDLQLAMARLQPRVTPMRKQPNVFVHPDLRTSQHVFVRVDRVRGPLTSPYEGPYPVRAREQKYFTLLIKGKEVTISIDRLKPAYLLPDEESPAPVDPTPGPSSSQTSTSTVPDAPAVIEPPGSPRRHVTFPDVPVTQPQSSRSGRPIIRPPRFRD